MEVVRFRCKICAKNNNVFLRLFVCLSNRHSKRKMLIMLYNDLKALVQFTQVDSLWANPPPPTPLISLFLSFSLSLSLSIYLSLSLFTDLLCSSFSTTQLPYHTSLETSHQAKWVSWRRKQNVQSFSRNTPLIYRSITK